MSTHCCWSVTQVVFRFCSEMLTLPCVFAYERRDPEGPSVCSGSAWGIVGNERSSHQNHERPAVLQLRELTKHLQELETHRCRRKHTMMSVSVLNHYSESVLVLNYLLNHRSESVLVLNYLLNHRSESVLVLNYLLNHYSESVLVLNYLLNHRSESVLVLNYLLIIALRVFSAKLSPKSSLWECFSVKLSPKSSLWECFSVKLSPKSSLWECLVLKLSPKSSLWECLVLNYLLNHRSESVLVLNYLLIIALRVF